MEERKERNKGEERMQNKRAIEGKSDRREKDSVGGGHEGGSFPANTRRPELRRGLWLVTYPDRRLCFSARPPPLSPLSGWLASQQASFPASQPRAEEGAVTRILYLATSNLTSSLQISSSPPPNPLTPDYIAFCPSLLTHSGIIIQGSSDPLPSS
ncbi:unnamed protein product [Pleuronectes platessa]|uniref:Uncharacterized protein n=1 Tax=Pleuronectes platessa TaxID=8262 RepID=A0A9N7YHS6_PLEPL|nr:unnamed protein product [Pleuronectes platessa]